jgi:hypothetical protein
LQTKEVICDGLRTGVAFSLAAISIIAASNGSVARFTKDQPNS